MKNKTSVIAIYSRKSKYTGKGESIGNQVELCREYIRMHYGDKEAAEAVVFEDEGFSGGNMNRPAFRRMMKQIENGTIGTLVVYRLDRVSRNVGDFSGLIDNLNRRNIVFVSIREQFDTATPMGRAMMYIASVFSQLERETIAERIRDNMHELAKTGRWLGGTTPTGYCSESVKSVTVDGKTKKACKLKLIDEEAKIVSIIFELFTQTGSLTNIEAELIKRGILTKNGNHFTRFSIKSILQNPVYMIADEEAYEYFVLKDADMFSPREAFDGIHGILAYNRTDQEKGRATVFNPVNEWIVSVGKHQGLIPGKVWVAVQDNLERNKSKSFRRPRRNEALLTGLLFCACGDRMYPKLSGRKNAGGNSVYIYVCRMKERSKKELCKCRNVSGNALDMAVIGQIGLLEYDKSDFVRQLEKSRMFYTGGSARNKQRIDSMQNEKTGIEFGELKKHLPEIDSSIDDMTFEQKRVAIRSVVHSVIWDGENAHIFLLGADDGGRADSCPEIKTHWCEDSK